MNSTFKLIVLILLMSNTFFSFFIAYDIYGKALLKEKTEETKIIKELDEYKRKISTLYYTNFIDSYNFAEAELSNINNTNIISLNPDILFNISYNCAILDNESFDKCSILFKEISIKKVSFINTIKNIQSSYEVKLGTIAFKETTIDGYNKEIENIVSGIMEEKDFETAKNEYYKSLKEVKNFLETEYTKIFK